MTHVGQQLTKPARQFCCGAASMTALGHGAHALPAFQAAHLDFWLIEPNSGATLLFVDLIDLHQDNLKGLCEATSGIVLLQLALQQTLRLGELKLKAYQAACMVLKMSRGLPAELCCTFKLVLI